MEPNTHLTINFEDTVVAGSGNITLTAGSNVITIDVDVDCIVSGFGADCSAMCEVSGQGPAAALWTVTMDAAAFQNHANEDIAPITGTTWQYRTMADVGAPYYLASNVSV